MRECFLLPQSSEEWQNVRVQGISCCGAEASQKVRYKAFWQAIFRAERVKSGANDLHIVKEFRGSPLIKTIIQQ